jgi:hypothetical protein
MESLENRRVLATTYTVNVTIDELDGIDDMQISLRDAIAEAVSGDTIEFDPTQMNGETIPLTLGQLEIAGESLTIDASMLLAGLTIQAFDPDRDQPEEVRGNGSRIFNITNPFGGTVVTMKGLTLTGGVQKRCQERMALG